MKDGEGIKDAPASSERSGNHLRQIALLSAEDPRDPLAWSGSIVDTKNLYQRSLREDHDGEQKALNHCAYALCASEWARDTATAHYEAPPDKVKFIRFGANIPKPPSRAEAEGFIPKNAPKGVDRFSALLASAHFSIRPSRAECDGLAPVEAAAFGVPSLVTNVGGLPSAVLQGKTGHLFDLDAPMALYCDRVEALLADPETYRDFCLCAHDTFRSTLSWAVSGPQVAGLIDEFSSREVASPENR